MNNYWRSRNREMDRRNAAPARSAPKTEEPQGVRSGPEPPVEPAEESPQCVHVHDHKPCGGEVMDLGKDGKRCYDCGCSFPRLALRS